MTLRSHDGKQTLGALAHQLGAELLPADAGALPVSRVGAFAEADEQTLLFAASASALAAACATQAAAVFTTAALAAEADRGKPLLVCDQPKLFFARAAGVLRQVAESTGVHPQALVAPDAVLGERVSIEAFAVIGAGAQLGDDVHIGAGTVIGADCVLGPGSQVYPRSVLYPRVVLGARVVVHAGAVLGSDGFGYVRDRTSGAYLQFPQQGRLVIGDDVEIGANTTIDRGALEETRIGRGVKLDNLVHVGHNVTVGEDVVIAAQTGISGSSSIGRGAVVAGQVGIADHVTIGEGAILGAQCGVPSQKEIRGPGVLFWGTPARPITQYLKELATLARLTKAGRKGR